MSDLRAKTEDAILARLADGESLSSICRDPEMPAWSTVHDWIDGDEALAGRITRAREVGYMVRADRAILEAKTADDAAKGRLAFDAERWYLGKLSNAFSENKPQRHEHTGKDGGAITILTGVPRDEAND